MASCGQAEISTSKPFFRANKKNKRSTAADRAVFPHSSQPQPVPDRSPRPLFRGAASYKQSKASYKRERFSLARGLVQALHHDH